MQSTAEQQCTFPCVSLGLTTVDAFNLSALQAFASQQRKLSFTVMFVRGRAAMQAESVTLYLIKL